MTATVVHWHTDESAAPCGQPAVSNGWRTDAHAFLRFAQMSAAACRNCQRHARATVAFEHAFPPQEDG